MRISMLWFLKRFFSSNVGNEREPFLFNDGRIRGNDLGASHIFQLDRVS